MGHFRLGKYPGPPTRMKEHFSNVLSLGIFCTWRLWLKFGVDYASHVSLCVSMASMRRRVF